MRRGGVEARILKTVSERGLLSPKDHVVIGLSGGPDSLCLFHVLNACRADLDIRFYAVHVNHRFRPGAAEADEAYVRELCRKYGVPLRVFSEDVASLAREWKMTDEEAGRRVRYAAFGSAAEDIIGAESAPRGSVKIAVAHNRNDQAETVLLRILRGTGPDGLAAMPYARIGENGVPVIRPLLDAERRDIEEYCEVRGLAARVDHTNALPVYRRNNIRLELIPLLRSKYNENIEEALGRLAEISGADREYFNKIVCEIINEHGSFKPGGRFVIPCEKVTEQDAALRLRIILACLEKIGLSQDAAAVHLKAAERLALAGETGKRVEFPGGYRLRRVYGMLEFFREEPEESEAGYARESRSVSFSDIEAAALVRGRLTLVCGGDGRVFRFTAGLIEAERGETKPTLGNDDVGGGVCSAGQSAECGADTLELDFDSITSACDGVFGLVIRRRQAGDWIRLSGMAGTKKLQDFFVNAKIRREQRERIPLLALGSEILWIPGYRKTGNYRAGGETKRVLTLTVSAEPAALPDETSPALNLSGSSEA